MVVIRNALHAKDMTTWHKFNTFFTTFRAKAHLKGIANVLHIQLVIWRIGNDADIQINK